MKISLARSTSIRAMAGKTLPFRIERLVRMPGARRRPMFRRRALIAGLSIPTIVLAALLPNVAPASAEPFAYTTNQGSSSVSVIDTATNTVVATVPVGSGPFGLEVTPDGAFVYVANVGSNSVSVIDTATNAVMATVPVGDFPRAVALTPPGAFVYVAIDRG